MGICVYPQRYKSVHTCTITAGPFVILCTGQGFKSTKTLPPERGGCTMKGKPVLLLPGAVSAARKDGLRAKIQPKKALSGWDWSHELPHAFLGLESSTALSQLRDPVPGQGVCPTLLWSRALGFHLELSHLCCTSVPKQKKFTLQLRFQHQAKVHSPGEVLGSPARHHLHRFTAGAHAPLSFPIPSESHPGQSRHAAGDMDVRHQMAQVYGPCATAEEKAAQRHNAGQGQHQDSPKRARRLSKHCPQYRWDAFPTPALMQRLCPAPSTLFAAGGQRRHPNIPRHGGVQGSWAGSWPQGLNPGYLILMTSLNTSIQVFPGTSNP